jgi:hypothetical protein
MIISTEAAMEQTHRFHPKLRRATAPTYVVSYAFPILFVVYELYRVGSWIATFGMDFTNFKQTGYEYTLMIAMFMVQVVVEALFLVIAWISRHADFEHRLTNLTLGLFCSFVVLAFDYLLQVSF